MKIVNEKDFENEVKDGLVLVDFFATWCGPCRMMAGVLDDAEKDLEGVKIVKVDVDESERLARKFGVMSIPTLVLLKNGNEVDSHIGLMSKSSLKEFVEKNK